MMVCATAFWPAILFSNMASPLRLGGLSGHPLTSRDIRITHQILRIFPAKDFRTAQFVVEYRISSNRSGRQMPMLFYALHQRDSFKVSLDGRPVSLWDDPRAAQPEFLLDKYSSADDSEEITIRWREDVRRTFKISDLRYFEMDLEEGPHELRVEYVSDVWEDVSDPVKRYSFHYALEPARYWASFGTMEVHVETVELPEGISSNLGAPHATPAPGHLVWYFNHLPADSFELSWKPQVSSLARWVMRISPAGMAGAGGCLLAILHFLGMIAYRKKNPHHWFSPVAFWGVLILPFLVLILYVLAFFVQDAVIGAHASRHHGYPYLALLMYPIFVLLYAIPTGICDFFFRKKFLTRTYSKKFNKES